jgi:biopolymer transport protein ExbD
MLNGIKLDLPKTKEVNPINLNAKQVILSFSKNEEFYLGKDKILAGEIVSEIQKQFKSNNSDTLFLRADFNLPYGKVAKLMSFLKRGGINHISLVTVTDDKI